MSNDLGDDVDNSFDKNVWRLVARSNDILWQRLVSTSDDVDGDVENDLDGSVW